MTERKQSLTEKLRIASGWRTIRGPVVPMIYQVEAAECSLACLAMVASHYGRNTTISDLRATYPVPLQGLSLRSIMDLASALNLEARAYRCKIDALAGLKKPVMLHWDCDHFVVLVRFKRGRYTIHDPARGVRTLSRDEVSNHFTGIVLGVTPADDFAPMAAGQRLTLGQLVGRLEWVSSSVLMVLGISALLEVLMLAQPMFIRYIVDVALIEGAGFIATKLVFFLALAGVLHAASGFLRDYAVLRAGSVINFHVAKRVFRHTLSLSLEFFEKRPAGHLVERYRIIQEIERFLVTSVPLGMIDGLMTLLSMTIIMSLAWELGVIALGTVLGFAAINWSTYRIARGREEELIWVKGEQNSHVIETLQSIQTIKSMALERARFSRWLNLYGDMLETQMSHGAVFVIQRTARHVVIACNLVSILYVASSLVRTGDMTIGVLLGALVYNAHFIARSALFVERAFELTLLGVRLERLEEIVFSRPEQRREDIAELSQSSVKGGACLAVTGALRMQGVHYNYGLGQRDILSGLDCEIAAGEFIAIIGKNGQGKTTLMKVMLGLYRATRGRVVFDGREIHEYSLQNLRSRIGVVTQDDQLLTGTVAEAIAVGDGPADMDRVIECAKMACVHDDIQSLVMGYKSRISDLGSPFSEGQKQKVFLARALYRSPALIIMDEGTANLDDRSEIQILTNLKRLPATKIMVAHRPATLRYADRVLALVDGRLEEVSSEGGSASRPNHTKTPGEDVSKSRTHERVLA